MLKAVALVSRNYKQILFLLEATLTVRAANPEITSETVAIAELAINLLHFNNAESRNWERLVIKVLVK